MLSETPSLLLPRLLLLLPCLRRLVTRLFGSRQALAQCSPLKVDQSLDERQQTADNAPELEKLMLQ